MAATQGRLAVDIMGGDALPAHLFDGLVAALPMLPSPLALSVLVAESHVTEQMMAAADERLEIVTAPAIIGKDDEPLAALRRKSESTLVKGVRGLAQGRWQALITCGNTGALVAATNMWLPKLSGVRRPALSAPLPLPGGDCLLLDVGATTHPTADLLCQHALLGARYWRALYPGSATPRLALLNIGQETHKGTDLLRVLYRRLSDEQKGGAYTFVGNVEGRFLTDSSADIVLSDGFTGNIFLKAVEGAFLFFLQAAARQLAVEGIATGVLEQRLKQFHYLEHHGALVAGSGHLIVKCHGAATAASLAQALRYAGRLLDGGFVARLNG